MPREQGAMRMTKYDLFAFLILILLCILAIKA